MNNLVKRRTCMEKTSKAYEKKVSPTKKKLDSSSNSVYQLTPPFNKIKPSDNSKESTKKLRDYVSYFKPNQQKNHLLNSNFELLQTDYENLKGALKRRQLLTKSNSNKRRESIKKFESNKIQDETANLSHTIENLKQNSINQKKNQSLKKILLISHTVPKNKQNDNLDNINKMKTLKKREENKEDQEKSTTLKKFKFQSSAEDELIDLLNKSFNTSI